MKSLALPITLALVVIGETMRVYLAATTPPDDRDAWERLREAHHCQPLRLNQPSEDITHDKTVWACDHGEFVVRNTD